MRFQEFSKIKEGLALADAEIAHHGSNNMRPWAELETGPHPAIDRPYPLNDPIVEKLLIRGQRSVVVPEGQQSLPNRKLASLDGIPDKCRADRPARGAAQTRHLEI